MPNKSFQLITNLTVNQKLSISSTWPITSLIKVHLEDFNVDGKTDLMLMNIGNVISGAEEQIVFSNSNGSSFTPPSSLSPMSESKRQFLVEALGVRSEPNYLLRTMIESGSYSQVSQGYAYGYFNTAYLQLYQMGYASSIFVNANDNPYDDSTQPSNCVVYACTYDQVGGQWQMLVFAEVIVTTWDFSIFHPTTLTFAAVMDDIIAGTKTMDDLLDVLELILGTLTCNGINPNEVDTFTTGKPYDFFLKNTCITASVARSVNAIHSQRIVYNGQEPSGDPRIQFRGRPVSFVESLGGDSFGFHASLHNSSNTVSYSGFPQNRTNPLAPGNLIKASNDPSDDPSNTLLVGFVDTLADPQLAFTSLLSHWILYQNNLQYCAVQVGSSCLLPLGSLDGYNSNGFAKGMADLVGNIVPIQHHTFPGAVVGADVQIFDPTSPVAFPGVNKPVPPNQF